MSGTALVLRLGTRLRTLLRALIAVTNAFLIAGCSGGGDASGSLGSRMWGTVTVAVESRPAPPRTGSNEIVVHLTGEHMRPVYDAVVFVRTTSNAEWTQAIEDGHVGVYRRAVRFAVAGDANLDVLLRRNGDEATFTFPVRVGAAS